MANELTGLVSNLPPDYAKTIVQRAFKCHAADFSDRKMAAEVAAIYRDVLKL